LPFPSNSKESSEIFYLGRKGKGGERVLFFLLRLRKKGARDEREKKKSVVLPARNLPRGKEKRRKEKATVFLVILLAGGEGKENDW